MKKIFILLISSLFLLSLTSFSTFAAQQVTENKLTTSFNRLKILEVSKQQSIVTIKFSGRDKKEAASFFGRMSIMDTGTKEYASKALNKVVSHKYFQNTYNFVKLNIPDVPYMPEKGSELATIKEKLYSTVVAVRLLSEGEHFLMICGERNSTETYHPFYCTYDTGISLYIKDGKLVSKEEYQNITSTIKEAQQKKDLDIANRFKKVFNEYKMKKTRYGRKTKYKTTDDLDKELFSIYEKYKDIDDASNIFANLRDKDDNDRMTLHRDDFKTYAKVTLTNKINKENKILQDKKKKEEAYKKEAISNYSNLKQNFEQKNVQLKKDLQIQTDSRKQAIVFSKKLLNILKQYKTKESKLNKIIELEKLLDNNYGPGKFNNQILISYVKDYLSIVKYAISLF